MYNLELLSNPVYFKNVTITYPSYKIACIEFKEQSSIKKIAIYDDYIDGVWNRYDCLLFFHNVNKVIISNEYIAICRNNDSKGIKFKSNQLNLIIDILKQHIPDKIYYEQLDS